MESIIESQNTSFIYPESTQPALQNVTLSVKPGQCILLCGKSGCGKTTFSRLLNGLSPVYFRGSLEGSCTVCGLKAGESTIESYVPLVGSVFQNPKTQYFNINTTAELAFPCENCGMPPAEIRRRVNECAHEFHLEQYLDRSIFHLSGGEKQQIACGAACVLHPQVLVLDEPTSNLDAAAILRLRDMILKMKQLHMTVVIAEHRLAWLNGVVDQCFFFADGKLVQQWSGKEFSSLRESELHKMGLRCFDLAPCKTAIREKTKCLPPQSNPFLSVRSLVIGYGKKTPLRQIEHFEIHRGEIIGLMGTNGTGKSTLAKTLCGLVKPLHGQILMDGKAAGTKALQQASFLVMQDVNYQLFSDSVEEEVLLGAVNPENAQQVLKALDLLELKDRHPMSLSGGQKQRTAIASAMLSQKSFLILDEPTSGLDRYHMEQVGRLLRQLKQQQKAVLVITHDEELAADWCDRIYDLNQEDKQ